MLPYISGAFLFTLPSMRSLIRNCSGGWLAATCSGDREVAVNEVANGAEGGLSGEARGAGDGAIPGVDLGPPF